MTWTKIAQIELENDWIYTSPVEGSYFRIFHHDYPTGGSFLISQFNELGEVFGYTLIKPGLFPEVVYLPKPPTATIRKLGFRLISALPWEITVEVSDYVQPPAGAVDLTPINNQLNFIADSIADIDVDFSPITAQLDLINRHVLEIPPTDLTIVNNKLDAIITKLANRRETISITTPSIAPNTVYNTTIPLGKVFLLLNIATSSPAWVRLYTSPAYRSADASRSITQNPTNNPNGIISEDITTASNLTIDLNGNGKFQGVGSSQESLPKSDIAIAAVNTSNSAQAITVSYNRILLES